MFASTSTPLGITTVPPGKAGSSAIRSFQASQTWWNRAWAALDLKMNPSVGRTLSLARASSRLCHCGAEWAVPTLQTTGAQSSCGRSTCGTGPICSPLAT